MCVTTCALIIRGRISTFKIILYESFSEDNALERTHHLLLQRVVIFFNSNNDIVRVLVVDVRRTLENQNLG